MKPTYLTLRKSYKASRALCQTKQAKIDELLVTYRLQSLGRALPKIAEINQRRAWVNREVGWALEEGRLGSLATPRTIMRRNDDLHAVGLAQTALIYLLIKLTTPNGNGQSPTQAYANMETGKSDRSFRTRRDRLAAAETASKFQEEAARIAGLVETRQAYRGWNVDPNRRTTHRVEVGDLGTEVDPTNVETWERSR
jgi:hypothetical protein